MPGCVIILPKTVSPKTVSKRLDLSFGILPDGVKNTVATLAGGNQLLKNRIGSPKSAKGRLKTPNWFSDDLYARDFQTTFEVV